MKNHALHIDQEEVFGELVSSYYSSLADWMDSVSWYRDDKVLEAVTSLIYSRPSNVLELCCGSGALLRALSRTFPDVDALGIDISSRMLALASEKTSDLNSVNFVQSDWLSALPTKPQVKKFDVLIVKNALHLLDDLPNKLNELERVSDIHSRLIVVETISPNPEANKFVRELFRFVNSSGIKQRFFTKKSLSRALSDGGWALERSATQFELEQHIEIDPWLDRKCTTKADRVAAEELIVEASQTEALGHSMKIDPLNPLKGTMLRLQHIGVYRRKLSCKRRVSPPNTAAQLKLI